MGDFGGREVKVHFVDNHSGTGESELDADYGLAKALQEQERAYSLARFNSTSGDYEEFHGSASSSSPFAGNHHLKSTLELQRDSALAQALRDADDQEQLVNMLTLTGLQDSHSMHQGETSTVQDDVDPNSMSYEELVTLIEAIGSENKGLTTEEISALSRKKYKPKCCLRSSENECCVICLQEYKRGVYMITLPCKHAYHAECIKKWLQVRKSCPGCGREVLVTKGKEAQ